MGGLPVTVRRVRCQAPGAPETVADVSLVRDGGLYRIGRVTYNDQARAVLDQGQTFPITRRVYNRYVLGGEAFNEGGLNTLLRVWSALGMRFRLNGNEYQCQVS